MSTLTKYISFILFTISTPIAVYYSSSSSSDTNNISIYNSFGFSIGMIGIYVYPFLSKTSDFHAVLTTATMNWVYFLTLFTEIVFQIPHSLCTTYLHENQGSFIEWPFRSYGLSDNRWQLYNPQPSYVYAINVNDAGLGIIVACALLQYKRVKTVQSKIMFILTLIFRDATLFRETVEYMYDHHRLNYPYTTTNPLYRSHAIICLWFVNILWIVAPLFTFLWSYYELKRILITNKKHA